MRKILIAALLAASTLAAAAPAAQAYPYGWRHHHHYWGHGYGWRRPGWGHRRVCYRRPYRCVWR